MTTNIANSERLSIFQRASAAALSTQTITLLAGIGAAILLWYVASCYEVRGLGDDIRPDKVVGRLITLLFDSSDFWTDYLATFVRVILSASLGVLLAVALGVGIGVSSFLDWLTRPLIYTLQSIPIIVLGLIFLLILGPTYLGAVSFVTLAVCLSLIPILVSSVRSVETNYIRIGKSLGFSRLRLVTNIIMPMIRPSLVDTCRAALIIAWSFMAFAEVMGGDYGLGLRITEFIRFNHSTDMFAYIVAISLSVVCGDLLLRLMRPIVCPWTRTRSR